MINIKNTPGLSNMNSAALFALVEHLKMKFNIQNIL